MDEQDDEENNTTPNEPMDELKLIREAMKNEAEAWKKLLANLEKLTNQKPKNDE